MQGRTLQKGEYQRASDKRYCYSYKDPPGNRKSIYAYDLVTLREKEKQLLKDQLDGLDIYVAGKVTVNMVFDRCISLKTNLRHTFCTRLCENETNLKVIQSIMGHKDIQTTMDIYAEATEEKKQESFERLAEKLDVF